MNSRRRNRTGFSLIEVLTALMLVSLALLPMLALATTLDKQSEGDSRYEEALAVARSALERCRLEPYAELEKGKLPEAEKSVAASKIQVTVSAKTVEDGLLRVTAVATWPSVTGPTARLELASLLADPDRSLSARYALGEVVK